MSGEFRIYDVAGLPPAVFGETYVVASGWVDGAAQHHGEYFLLTQRPESTIDIEDWALSQTEVPEHLLRIDIGFMIGESVAMARQRIFERLQARAKDLDADVLLTLPFKIEECRARPLAGAWLRGQFHTEIAAMRRWTGCQQLQLYLGGVTSLPTIR